MITPRHTFVVSNLRADVYLSVHCDKQRSVEGKHCYYVVDKIQIMCAQQENH